MSYMLIIALALGITGPSCTREDPCLPEAEAEHADFVLSLENGNATKVTESTASTLLSEGFKCCTWNITKNTEHMSPVTVSASSGEFPTGRQWPGDTYPIRAFAVYPPSLTLTNGVTYSDMPSASFQVGSASEPYDGTTDVMYAIATKPLAATTNGRMPLEFNHAMQYPYGLKIKLDNAGTQFKARILYFYIECCTNSTGTIYYGTGGVPTVAWSYSSASATPSDQLSYPYLIPQSNPTPYVTGTSYTDVSSSLNRMLIIPFGSWNRHWCSMKVELVCGNETRTFISGKNIPFTPGVKTTIEATIATSSGDVSISVTEDPWTDGGVTEYTY